VHPHFLFSGCLVLRRVKEKCVKTHVGVEASTYNFVVFTSKTSWDTKMKWLSKSNEG